MKIVVIGDDWLKKELLEQGLTEGIELVSQSTREAVDGTDAYIDLSYDQSQATLQELQKLPAQVIVNSVSSGPGELPPGFCRVNGWPGFLKRPVAECSGNNINKTIIENIFTCFHKKTEWVPDIPGFISARVVSMIINEAWFTLEEKVSTKEAIDTAMKLGTNYPYGPFEWGEKIGLKNICSLLNSLAETNPRYQPSTLLQQQVA